MKHEKSESLNDVLQKHYRPFDVTIIPDSRGDIANLPQLYHAHISHGEINHFVEDGDKFLTDGNQDIDNVLTVFNEVVFQRGNSLAFDRPEGETNLEFALVSTVQKPDGTILILFHNKQAEDSSSTEEVKSVIVLNIESVKVEFARLSSELDPIRFGKDNPFLEEEIAEKFALEKVFEEYIGAIKQLQRNSSYGISEKTDIWS